MENSESWSRASLSTFSCQDLAGVKCSSGGRRSNSTELASLSIPHSYRFPSQQGGSNNDTAYIAEFINLVLNIFILHNIRNVAPKHSHRFLRNLVYHNVFHPLRNRFLQFFFTSFHNDDKLEYNKSNSVQIVNRENYDIINIGYFFYRKRNHISETHYTLQCLLHCLKTSNATAAIFSVPLLFHRMITQNICMEISYVLRKLSQEITSSLTALNITESANILDKYGTVDTRKHTISKAPSTRCYPNYFCVTMKVASSDWRRRCYRRFPSPNFLARTPAQRQQYSPQLHDAFCTMNSRTKCFPASFMYSCQKKKVAALVNSEYFQSPLRVAAMLHDACACTSSSGTMKVFHIYVS
ncbi:hypothetical protein ANN_14689 [Periplaneta americana]|uniref:Uncharacterized protein n=1 Tax=Periplaneta americana TaxID=6978 RepID=A0ABQ8SY89_PERAM|nr:hypothetical protein ANN_14689 [Periplaneta americana]